MSQAHYFGTCSWFVDPYACTDDVVALLHVPMGRGSPMRPVCKTHLDVWLDWSDGDLLGPMEPEPLKIDWVWDAGTRICLLHHWPDVLCAGWTDEHKRLVSALTTST